MATHKRGSGSGVRVSGGSPGGCSNEGMGDSITVSYGVETSTVVSQIDVVSYHFDLIGSGGDVKMYFHYSTFHLNDAGPCPLEGGAQGNWILDGQATVTVTPQKTQAKHLFSCLQAARLENASLAASKPPK